VCSAASGQLRSCQKKEKKNAREGRRGASRSVLAKRLELRWLKKRKGRRKWQEKSSLEQGSQRDRERSSMTHWSIKARGGGLDGHSCGSVDLRGEKGDVGGSVRIEVYPIRKTPQSAAEPKGKHYVWKVNHMRLILIGGRAELMYGTLRLEKGRHLTATSPREKGKESGDGVV